MGMVEGRINIPSSLAAAGFWHVEGSELCNGLMPLAHKLNINHMLNKFVFLKWGLVRVIESWTFPGSLLSPTRSLMPWKVI